MLIVLGLLILIVSYIYNKKVNEPLYYFKENLISKQEEIIDIKLMYGGQNRFCNLDVKIRGKKAEINRKYIVEKIIYEINQEPFASYILRKNKDGDEFIIWINLNYDDEYIRIESG